MMNLTALCLIIGLTLDIISKENEMRHKEYPAIIFRIGTEALRVRRLIGGTNATESEFPYQVSLRYYDLHICSGVLISDRHVLSAAHCVCGLIDEPAEELGVRIGNINSKEGEAYAVETIKCHHDYVYDPDESWVADLVVIKLAERIHTSPSQSPIVLATYDTIVGERAVISGWGRVHPFSFLSRNLQKLSVPIIDNEVCQEYYKNITILSSQICTFEREGIGACKGDSGSPLVYNNILIGIFSWTKPCAIGFPDVFTRVNSFTEFIEQSIQDD